MMEKILETQQKTNAYLNLRLDVLYKELNGKFETLDAHVMMLDAQVSQTVEAVKKQEDLVKGKVVESERHQVNASFGEVLKQEKLEEDAFLIESSISIGSSYWCRPTPKTEHRPTPTAEHQSTSTAEHQSHHQPSIDRHHFWDQTKLLEFRATQILLLDIHILSP
ncbi:hypothetical protein F2Q70_00036346 [Brassica cretica]|uniref:Uncharacterized protein n=1 Tax=Brassica cretica TaxID=69181 RepID=A0A8S9K1P7_BRACR|nr:hypothetical protein F2Q68_00031534 [Brassica cretica]KAF2587316.1 hypothetical protein F2Q70_00036346 [Brassica cretica]